MHHFLNIVVMNTCNASSQEAEIWRPWEGPVWKDQDNWAFSLSQAPVQQ